MKHRIIALIFGLVGFYLVALWMRPGPIEHVGHLNEHRLVVMTVRDASGARFNTEDTVFIRQLAAAMDEVPAIGDVAARMSRGYVELAFTRATDLPIKVEVLCHIKHGPVLRENRNYAGPEMVKVMQLIALRFPEGRWCPDEAGSAPR
ncbi:MAG: hypothetical protein JNL05_01435 [Flavobacteriales bacterium]|nr:hypothetical protein [Flavobacteriales bacterium]